jgi:peptide/nickel transport system substrate-binding protein
VYYPVLGLVGEVATAPQGWPGGAGPLSRRAFVQKLGLGAASLAVLPELIACGTGSSSGPSTSTTGTPKKGGSLVVSLDADAATLNPITTQVNETYWVSNQIFDTLLRYDKNFNPTPGLARSWTISPDGKTYEFTLAQNVKWHDGTPFTSADVRFSYQTLGPKYNPNYRTVFKNLSSIDDSNPGKVVLRFSQPSGALLSYLGDPNFNILPQHVFSQGDARTNPANSNPVGTGAFKLKEWVRGDHITLVRNENYWEAGLPYFDQVTFQITPNAPAATSALERGDIGFVLIQIQPVDAKRLSGSSNLKVLSPSVLARTLNLWPNLRNAPLNDLKVREALSLAMDRARMVRDIAFGSTNPARSPIGSKSPYFDSSLPVLNRNVQKANQLLDDAGRKKGSDGTRFALKLRVVASVDQFVKTAQIVKENLADVGINVNIVAAETSTTLDLLFNKWDFDLGVYSMPLGPEPNLQWSQWYGSESINHAAFSNAEGYSNPEFDSLVTQSQLTVDKGARTKIYDKLQQTVMKDLPSIPLWEPLFISGYRTEFVNAFTQPDDRYIRLLGAWKA